MSNSNNMYYPMTKECVVRSTLAVVLRLGRILGVAPLRFEPIGNGYRVSISNYFKMYSYIFITCLNVLTFCALLLDFQKRAIRTKSISNLPFFMPDLITAMSTSTFGGYYCVRRMQIMMKHLNLLEKTRRNIDNNVIRLTPKRTIAAISYVILAFSCVFTFGCDLWYNYFWKEKLLTILYSIYLCEYFPMILWEIQVILLILEVQSVLLAINTKMKQMISKKIQGLPLLDALSSMKCKIRALSHAYITVCDVISEMNRLNGGIIVIIFINFIITSIMSLYFEFFLLNVLSPLYLFMQYAWCTIYIILVVAFLESCHSIKIQEVQMKINLSKLLFKYTQVGNRVPIELEIMYKNLVLNKPVYTPMKVFTLQRSLITTITSAVVTYMFFMVQLKL